MRLILIDAPEIQRSEQSTRMLRPGSATTYLSWLLSLGGDLYLETDVSDRDRFGRLLRYVWLDFGGGEVYLVNEALVRAGYAAFSTFPPDVKYVEEIREAGQFAREYGYGLWSGCITDDEGDTNELSGNQGINAGQWSRSPFLSRRGRSRPRASGHDRSGTRVSAVSRPIPTSASRRHRLISTVATWPMGASPSTHPTRIDSTATSMASAVRADNGPVPPPHPVQRCQIDSQVRLAGIRFIAEESGQSLLLAGASRTPRARYDASSPG